MFIDYSKAFNSISQVQMFEILSEIGFPKHIFALLEALYNDQLTKSSAFMIERGLGQDNFLYRSGVTKQIPENEISSLVGVDSSQLWRRMLDSNEN